MTLYEVLQYFTKPDNYRGAIFQDEGKNQLESETDVAVFNLLKNVSSIGVVITLKDVKFSPAIVLDGKRTFGPQDILDSDYDVLKSLDFEQIPNYIRCKIADLLWVEEKYFPAAQVAASTYLEMYKEYFSEENWMIGIRWLYRVVCISLQIRCQAICEEVSRLICETLKKMDAEGKDSISIRLIEILIEQDLQDEGIVLPILERIISKGLEPIQKLECAYQMKLKYLEKKKFGTDIIKAVNMALAQLYEAETEKHNASTFQDISVMLELLRKAFKIYRDNGEANEAQRVQRRIVELQGELPQMRTSIVDKYDVSKLHQYLVECFEGLSFEESIIRVTQLMAFKKKDEVKNTLYERMRDYPLLYLMCKHIMNEKGQTVLKLPPLDLSNPEKNASLFNAYLHQELYKMEEEEGSLFYQRALGIIRDNHDFTIRDLDFLIQDNAIIPQGREQIFQSALYMALRGDYYVALHVLAPQMENLFRNLAEEFGALTATIKDDGTSEAKVLSSVFDLPELIDGYDNDILFTFAGLLNERAGANIRNEVAHGLMSEAFAHSGVCVYFICAVIKFLINTSPRCYEIYGASNRLQIIKAPQEDIVLILVNDSTSEN